MRRDRLAEDTVLSSGLMRVFEGVQIRVAAASADSIAVRRAASLRDAWRNRSRPERIRMTGWCLAVASAAAIGLRAAAPRPEPLAWLLPAAVGAGAIVVILLARPLAAAWDGRR